MTNDWCTSCSWTDYYQRDSCAVMKYLILRKFKRLTWTQNKHSSKITVKDRVSPTIACFVPEYTGMKKTGRNPAIEAMFKIVPPSFLLCDPSFKSFRIKSIPINVELTTPVWNIIQRDDLTITKNLNEHRLTKLVSITFWGSSSFAIPAAFMTMSKWPSSSLTSSITFFSLLWSTTEQLL